jgi:Mg-chelatase subunit ChlD
MFATTTVSTESVSIAYSINSVLEFHNIDYPEWRTSTKSFGTLNITLDAESVRSNENQSPITWDVVFSVDTSGSMSDVCADSRTKMSHIIHTLSNILRLFSTNSHIKVNVFIQNFNDRTKTILDFTEITEFNVPSLITLVEKMYPDGQTDLVKPLIQCNELYKKRKAQYPNNRFVHIMLTDGEDNLNSLGKINDICYDFQKTHDYKSIFVGFGIQHDSELLASLASETSTNEYYFIDKLENSGFVYGEIIHNILELQYESLKIQLLNGKIYNWKTNQWVTTLAIGELYTNKPRTFHIQSETPNIVLGSIYGKHIKSTIKTPQLLDEITSLPNLMALDSNAVLPVDLTPYIYRQKVQELCYECMKHAKHPKPCNITLKSNLSEFFKTMKNYVKSIGETKNVFWNVLLDDVFILYKTLNTPYGFAFSYSRYISQGLERTYNVTNIQELLKNIQQMAYNESHPLYYDIRNNHNAQSLYSYKTLRSPTLMREYTQDYSMSEFDEDDSQIYQNSEGHIGYVEDSGEIYEEIITDCEDDEIVHELSNNIDSPYMTQNMYNIMHSLSSNSV